MGGMVTAAVYFLIALAVALPLGAALKPRAIGWIVAGAGVCFLVHAGVTIAIIWAHNNEVPPYVNFWGLFATIPAGLVLVLTGTGIICMRHCLARMKKPPE
jgi:hypothetical protein